MSTENKIMKLEPKKTTTEGSVKVTILKANGMETEKKVSFADGFPVMRPIPGEDVLASTQDVMDLARGEAEFILDHRYKKFSDKPELAAKYAQPLSLSQEDALQIITNLSQKQSAMIKAV